MADRAHRVFVSGPLSRGNVSANIYAAMAACDQLLRAGLVPFCPHWACYQDTVFPRQYEEWLAYDLHWLAVCDAALRLPGDSPGADREVAEAMRLGIPVYSSVETLVAELAGK